jgi:hypothetical protein
VKRTLTAWMVGFLVLGWTGIAGADDLTKPVTRLSRGLAELGAAPTPEARAAAAETLQGTFEWRPVVTGDWVTIDAVAAGDPVELESELIALGATDTAIAAYLVSARLPIAAIPFLEGIASLRFARQAFSTTHAGHGSGVTIGVLSDSFNCLGGANADMSSGDLPPTVTVLEEAPGCSSVRDEGRALLQIIHDVAPGVICDRYRRPGPRGEQHSRAP